MPVPSVKVMFITKTESEVYTPNCPLQYHVYAQITADGPVDLTYQFLHGTVPDSDVTPLHFAAADTKIVSNSVQVGAATPTVFEDSVVVEGAGRAGFSGRERVHAHVYPPAPVQSRPARPGPRART